METSSSPHLGSGAATATATATAGPSPTAGTGTAATATPSPAGQGAEKTPSAPAPGHGDAAATSSSSSSSAQPLPPQFPATSLDDDGKSRRPRDIRLMHMLLASQGVAAYQERVPLQLLDFAYRYTVNTLQDAVYLVTEGYPGGGTEAAGGAPTTTGGSKTAHHHHPPHDLSTISLAALRMSIASRLHYQFQPTLPKDFLLEMAAERNRVVLPGAVRGLDAGAAPASNSVLMGGIRLPPEQFCQTGVAWDLKEEWESDGEGEGEKEAEEKGQKADVDVKREPTGDADAGAGDNDGDGDGDEEMEDDDGDGRMEDLFGEEPSGDGRGGGGASHSHGHGGDRDRDRDREQGDKLMTGM